MLAFAAALCQALAAPAAPVWRADFDVAQSKLSNGLPEWREESVSLARRFDGATISARLEHVQRFGRHESYGELRVDRAFSDAWSGYLAIGGGEDVVFRPEAALRLGAAAETGAATTLIANIIATEYASGPSQAVKLGLEHRLWRDRVALDVRWIGVSDPDGALETGFSLGGAWRGAGRFSFRVNYADAPEFDGQGMAQIQTASLGAALDLNDATSLRISMTAEDRPTYARSEASLGVMRRF